MAKAPKTVDALLASSDHPLIEDIQKLRGYVLGVDPAITEGVKWNAPSYRLNDDFATVHMRLTDTVGLIFHTGAKKRAQPLTMELDDPSGLVEWLAPDRCLVRAGSGRSLVRNRKSLEGLLRQWVDQLP